MSEILVRTEGLGKKFCRNLKRSMYYGLKDIVRCSLGWSAKNRDLRKDEFWALRDINFELKRGEVLGVIGPNGSGKTTLLKLLNGIIQPDAGRIEIQGSIGALIQVGAGFHPLLTGRENIYINGSILGLSKDQIDERFDEIVSFAEIESFLDSPVKHYSSGMFVRLGFAIAVHCEPDILLIDEILSVGDMGFKSKCFNRIAEMLERTAVVFVSHNMANIAKISSEILLLSKGECLFRDKDIGRGIERYFEQFTPPRGREYGNDAIRLQSCRISGNREKGDLEFGKDCFVDLEFVYEKDIRPDVLIMTFVNGAGSNVAVSYLKMEGASHPSGKVIAIRVLVPSLPLSAGNYSLDLSFTRSFQGSMNGRVVSLYRNAAAFRVTRSPVVTGIPVQIPSGIVRQEIGAESTPYR